jgi:hypothetical protein
LGPAPVSIGDISSPIRGSVKETDARTPILAVNYECREESAALFLFVVRNLPQKAMKDGISRCTEIDNGA